MNIFQGIADKFKAVPEILRAKARAGQSQIQAQKVEQQLQERLKKPVAPSGNVFKDIVDKYKAPVFDAKKPVCIFESGSKPAQILERQKIAGEKMRQDVGQRVVQVAEAIPKQAINVFEDISRAGGVVARRYGIFKEPEKPPAIEINKGETIRDVLKREPTLYEVGKAGVERTPLGVIPGVGPVVGFLSEMLLPPWGLGKARLARNLAKEGDITASKLLIKQGIKDISEEEAEALARKTAMLTDEKAVTQELENFAKTKESPLIKLETQPTRAKLPSARTVISKNLQPLAQEARRYKTAEEFVKAQELSQTLRGTKGMTAADIMKTYSDIKLSKDVPATDIYGNKVKIPDGEVLTPYELKGNKVLLQDGETYVVSKSQFQNIKGQSVSKEAVEFAPELKG